MTGNHPSVDESYTRTIKTGSTSFLSIYPDAAIKFRNHVLLLQRSNYHFILVIIILFAMVGERCSVYGQNTDTVNHGRCFLADGEHNYLIADLSDVTFEGSFTSEEKNKQYYRNTFKELLEVELSKKNISFTGDTLLRDPISLNNPDSISAILNNASCNWYVAPVSCTITKKIIQKPGWRNNRSGPSYERPEETELKTVIKVVILNNEGKEQFRITAEGRNRRPFMYNVFSRFSKKEGIDKYANSLYAPPELKSLYKAIKSLCSDQSRGG